MGAINEFIGVVKKSNGLAKANRYEVDIIAPGNHPGGAEGRNLNLLCNAITMPGHNLQQQTQRLATEPAREMVQSRSFAGNITASFYLDQGLEIKSWFDKWLELAINPATHTIGLLTIEFAYRRWIEIENTESGTAFKTRLPDTIERLPGNGVLREDFAERRRIRDIFNQ